MCTKTRPTTTTEPHRADETNGPPNKRTIAGESFRAMLLGLGRGDRGAVRGHDKDGRGGRGDGEACADEAGGAAWRHAKHAVDRRRGRREDEADSDALGESGRRREKGHGREAEDAASMRDLAPFTAPPAILAPPSASAGAPAATGSALAHAQAAALAERLVTSLRVGRVGRDGHEVRMDVAVSARADVKVQLRWVDGALSARFSAPPHATADAERLASALSTELGTRGFTLHEVSVEID